MSDAAISKGSGIILSSVNTIGVGGQGVDVRARSVPAQPARCIQGKIAEHTIGPGAFECQ